MPPSFLSRNGKGLLLGGGAAVLVGGFLLFFFGGGWYLVLLLFMGLSTHDNDAPAGQLTVAQGTVLNAETRQPIPGMLLSVRSYSGYSPSNASHATDSGRTDAQGRYRLRFRNQTGRYYRVVVDYPPGDFSAPSTRYWFANPDDTASARDLTLGRVNTVNFYPGERHTIAVRLHNRRTGYRFLQMPDGYELPLSDRDTTIHLTYYELPAAGIKLHYLKRSGEEGEVDDTAVALVLQNPAARFPDTVRATLTFVR
jgi:FtsP/CotA-like multicopper oxidase with cupredoxin domain